MEKLDACRLHMAEARKLCMEFGINAELNAIEDEMGPAVDFEGKRLTLNVGLLSEDQIEEFVWYYVQLMLLPELRLRTERLEIRRLLPDDRDSLIEMLRHEQDAIDDGDLPITGMNKFEDRFSELVDDEKRYAIVLCSSGEAIGLIKLTERKDRAISCYEVGYAITNKYQRRGLGYEAVSALLDFCAKRLHIGLFLARTFEWNHRSQNMLIKLGFIEEGFEHKAYWHPKFGAVDMLSYYKE